MKTLTLMTAGIFVALVAAAHQQRTPPRGGPSSYHGLEVHISPLKPSYLPNEPLEIRIEFRNEGNTTIRVGREVGMSASAPFRLSVKIEDPRGRVVLDPMRDLVELPCADLREPDARHPTIWADIEPGLSYSAILTITTKALKNAQPGLYRIHGHYRSYGLLKGGHCMNSNTGEKSQSSTPLSADLEWKGEVDTNTVSITILSTPEAR